MEGGSVILNSVKGSAIAISAVSVAIMGLSGLVYSVKQKRAQERKAVEAMFDTKNIKNQNNDSSNSTRSKKRPHKVNLYFDQNDELVDEEVALKDKHNYYHKYHCVAFEFDHEEEE